MVFLPSVKDLPAAVGDGGRLLSLLHESGVHVCLHGANMAFSGWNSGSKSLWGRDFREIIFYSM
jgi:hypothetical protein